MLTFAEIGIGVSRKLTFPFSDRRHVDAMSADKIFDQRSGCGGCKPIASANASASSSHI
jgi:hypothetical protein